MSQNIINFDKFFKENPIVWDKFLEYSDNARNRTNKLGVAMIWERLRWYSKFETTEIQFKLNNNYKSFYARLYMAYRNCPKFFDTRGSLADDYDYEYYIQIINHRGL